MKSGMNLGDTVDRSIEHKWKRTGVKSSKKTDLRFACQVCKKTHIKGSGTRAKKVEFK